MKAKTPVVRHGYIRGFDSLRALSIIMVLLTHLGVFIPFLSSAFFEHRVLPLFSGLTGVRFFFTLSGFLITHLLLREKKETGTVRMLHFYMRRFIRLLPPLVIFYIMYLSMSAWGCFPLHGPGLLFSLFYVYNFIPNMYYSGELGHMWSLSVEEQFYLVWPWVLMLLASFIKKISVLLLVLCVCLYFVFLLPVLDIEYHGNVYHVSSYFQTERFTFPAIAPIMMGCLVAVVVNYRPNLLSFFVNKVALSTAMSLLLFMSPLYLPEFLLPLAFIFQSAGISIIMLLIYLMPESRMVSLIHRQPLIYIGKISYGIYVYQGLFLRTGPAGAEWPYQHVPLNIILTLLLAVVSYEWVEKKILTFKIRYAHSV